MWTALTVDVTPSGGTKFTREGNTLSVLRKENGKWLLVRDANTLPPMSGEDELTEIMGAMIELAGLTKPYGPNRAVDDLTFASNRAW